MKKTGKALSLLLSAALVVSSLTATFASAATTKTEYVPATTSGNVVYLANGLSGNSSKTDITGASSIPYSIASGVVTKDHLDVGALTATDISYKSGSNLLSLSIDSTNSKVFAQLSSESATGTEVVAVRYTGTSYRYTDPTQAIQFSAEVDYTVKVLANNSVVLSSSKTAPVDLGTVKKNADNGTAINAYVLKVTRGTNSQASFNAVDLTATHDASSNFVSTGITSAQVTAGMYFVKAANSNTVNCTTASADTAEADVAVTKQPANAEFFNVGSLVVYAIPLKWDATNSKAILDNANTVSSATTVDNTVNVPAANNEIKMWHGSTYAMPAAEAANVSETTTGVSIVNTDGTTNVQGPVADAINVTGANIVINGTVTMDNGSVGTVSGTGTLVLSNGTVTAITDSVANKGTTNLTMSNGNVGSITRAGTVAINGGVVGSVSANSVTVDAADSKVPTTVGAITAASVDVKSTYAATKTGNITATNGAGTVTAGPAADSNSIDIEGSNTTVGAIDLDHYAATINLKAFNGSIVAPLNAENGTVATPDDAQNNKTNATITGNANFNQVNVTDGTLTIANSLKVATVTGAGTLVIPAGGMYVSNTMNSVSLKLSNASITSGMTAFTAAPYKLYDGMFKTVGFTIDYDAISAVTGTRTIDTFKVKAVNFAGLTIAPVSGTSNKIALNDKATFKVSAYPAGTSLPDNTKVDFSFSGSSDNFSYTTTADTITISATKFDDLFSSLNKGTITATLVDATTDTPIYQYNAVTYDVQMVKTPEVSFKSDTTGTVNMKAGGVYQFKITSADGSVPDFAVANGGATVAPYTRSGNDFFFRVTAAKAGNYGVYVGNRIAMLAITGTSIDTTKVTIKAGKVYQFKVTAAKAPRFQVANVGEIKPYSVNGNDYFFRVTATKEAGAHGVYVDGVRLAAAIFA